MWPYWLLFSLMAFMAIATQRPKPIGHPTYLHPRIGFAWTLAFVLLTATIGLRYEVGGDWSTYADHVANMWRAPIYEIFNYSDAAYGLLNWIGANIWGDVYFVNTVSAMLFCWGLFTFCRAQPQPWLAMLVAVPYLIVVVAMGYTRQGVAIGLAMLAITRLSEGRMAAFLAWIALAALFHKSAVILVPFAVFANTKNKYFKYISAASLVFVLFSILIQDNLSFYLENYIDEGLESTGAGIRIAMNAVPALLLLLLSKRMGFSSESRGFWLFMALGAIIFVPILILSPSSTIVDRIALYWIPLQVLVLSRIPDALGVPGKVNVAWTFLVILYSGSVMATWMFFASHSSYWLPYRFTPWVAL